MRGTLDHVLWAWDNLDEITSIFADVGLEPDYGGTHRDTPTEMAMLGFEDSTYIELIAPVTPSESPEQWPESMLSAGPSRWCLRTNEIEEALATVSDAGADVWGPEKSSRTRPDGTTVEFEEAVYGSDDTFWRLPFLLRDVTPRANRVQASASVAGGSLTGIAEVVIAVGDIEDAIRQFRQLHGYSSPNRAVHDAYEATLASFPAQPVTLAEPIDEASWLADRLRQHQEGPCTVLIESEDLSTAGAAYHVSDSADWFNSHLRWFDAPQLRRRLGVVEA